MSSRLTSYGLPTIVYHAGLSKADRESNQQDWSLGRYPIVAATISFGMGVDKANVRFVLHWTLPKSLGAYYQESGRAGRDGQLAHCRIYYSRRERDTVLFLTHKTSSVSSSRNKESSEQRKLDVDTMVDFVESVVCRHRQFAEYFQDEPLTCKDRCDVCVSAATVSNNLSAFRNSTLNRFTQAASVPNGQHDLDGKEEGCSASQLEENDRLGRMGLIEEEFRKRRKASSQDIITTSWLPAPANSRLIDPDNRRLAGITGRTRDQTLQLLVEALKAHSSPALRTSTTARKLESGDDESHVLVQSCAEAEFALFNESKVAAMYRTRMARLITKLRRPETSLAEAWEAVQSKAGAKVERGNQEERVATPAGSTRLPCPKSEPPDDRHFTIPTAAQPMNSRPQGQFFPCNLETSLDISDREGMPSMLKMPPVNGITKQNGGCVVTGFKASTVLKRERLDALDPFNERVKKIKPEPGDLTSKSIANKREERQEPSCAQTNREAKPPTTSSITYFWERRETCVPGQTPQATPKMPTDSTTLPTDKNRQKSILKIDTNLDSSSDSTQKPSSSWKRHGDSLPAAELAKLVVLALSPHFAKGRFRCKDAFKAVAKTLTQKLYSHGWSATAGKPAIQKRVGELMKSALKNPVSGPSDIDWSVLSSGEHV